jgi:hypothetical protein
MAAFLDKMLAHCRCGDGRANLLQAGLRRSLWAVVVIGGFGASRGPAEKIIGPKQAGRKCDGRIFCRDG